MGAVCRVRCGLQSWVRPRRGPTGRSGTSKGAVGRPRDRGVDRAGRPDASARLGHEEGHAGRRDDEQRQHRDPQSEGHEHTQAGRLRDRQHVVQSSGSVQPRDVGAARRCDAPGRKTCCAQIWAIANAVSRRSDLRMTPTEPGTPAIWPVTHPAFTVLTEAGSATTVSPQGKPPPNVVDISSLPWTHFTRSCCRSTAAPAIRCPPSPSAGTSNATVARTCRWRSRCTTQPRTGPHRATRRGHPGSAWQRRNGQERSHPVALTGSTGLRGRGGGGFPDLVDD